MLQVNDKPWEISGPRLRGRATVAFVNDAAEVCKLLEHIGLDSQATRISPARGPPLGDDCDVQAGEGVEPELELD